LSHCWDKCACPSWDKHSLSQLGLGKVKRDLSLSHGTSHIPTLEAFPCPGTSSIPTMELVPVPLVPTCPTKWVYKAVKFSSIFSAFYYTSNFLRILRILLHLKQLSHKTNQHKRSENLPFSRNLVTADRKRRGQGGVMWTKDL